MYAATPLPAPRPPLVSRPFSAALALRPALRALAAHDAETFAHTRRVVRLARALAHALGLSADERASLLTGAALHDLGKLAVPRDVLGKPGALTAHEAALVRAHPGVGAQLARRLGVEDEAALLAIAHHHERWNGRGYGDGLRGERIPLLARVLAVVDVYDALTSARAYKAAWPREAALAEVRREAGKRFDPRVAAAFVRTAAGARLAA